MVKNPCLSKIGKTRAKCQKKHPLSVTVTLLQYFLELCTKFLHLIHPLPHKAKPNPIGLVGWIKLRYFERSLAGRLTATLIDERAVR